MVSDDTSNTTPNHFNLLEKLLMRSVNKEEFSSICKFQHGRDIKRHIKLLECKFTELETPDKDRTKLLCDSLGEDVRYEMYSLPDFAHNRQDYTWLVMKLEELFKPKVSEINPLLGFLSLKQEPHQNLRDFLSTIRVEAWKIMGAEDPTKREEYCVMAFINGIASRKCSLALKQLSPQTLEQAYSMIKHADINEHPTVEEQLRMMQHQHGQNNANDMQQQVEAMQREITELKVQIAQLARQFKVEVSKPSYAQVTRQHSNSAPVPRHLPAPEQRSSRMETTCYNCHLSGHFARQCPHPVVCRYCKEVGHTIQQCIKRPPTRPHDNHHQQRRLRQLQHDECFSEPDTIDMVDQNWQLAIKGSPEIDWISTASSHGK